MVQFGGRRSPGGRWLPRIALACLILAAIVAVAVRGAGHHPQDAAKTPPPPAVRVIAIGHPLHGVTAGWELFARGPDHLRRIQLAHGKISVTYVPPLLSANPDVAFVIGAHEAVIRSADLVPGYVVPDGRSEEHTSELQSRRDLVCRLLLEKKKKKKITPSFYQKKKKKKKKISTHLIQ